MAQFPDDPGSDFIPGSGGSQTPSAPAAPQGWPAGVPYPGKGTPLEDVQSPDQSQGEGLDEGQRVKPPGTLDTPRIKKPQITGPQIRQILNESRDHLYGYSQTKLSPQDEARFQQQVKQSSWYKTTAATFGHEPSLDDPSYDYRGAWKNGEAPKVGEQWPTGARSGDQTYISPTHPYATKHFVQKVTGIDVSDMHGKDVNNMITEGTKAMMAEQQQAKQPEALPGHAVDNNTGRQIPLSSDPKDAIDTRPRPTANNKMSKGRTRQPDDEPGVLTAGAKPTSGGGTLDGSQAPARPKKPEDEPGTLLAHHETSETVEEPGTGEGRNVYGREQGGLAGKPLPGDKERYPNVDEAAKAAAERSHKMPDEGEMSEKGKRARAKSMVAGPGAPKPQRGYGPGGQYSKEEWDAYGPELEKGAAAPAKPTAEAPKPAAPAAAPATVGESRKTYMQKRLKDIEEGR